MLDIPRRMAAGLHEAVGDLIYVGTQPRPANSPWVTTHLNQEIRRAVLMIRGRDERGQLHVRLVQDYGRPDDPDAPLLQRRRCRGRPSKKSEAA